MPWCEDCAKYWAPSSMTDDGRCPSCDRVIEAPPKRARVTADTLDLKSLAAGDESDEDAAAPWHFKLLVLLLCIYLAWRIVDLVT